MKTPPRAHGVPLLGNMLDFAVDPLGSGERWVAEHGDAVELHSPIAGAYLFNHPDHVEQILARDFKKYRKDLWTRQLTELLGQGLVTSEGDFWKRQRRAINPGFHHQRIAGYAEVMVEQTLGMLDAWPDRDELDIHEALMELTFLIVAKTLFGADVTEDADDVGRILEFYMEYARGVAGTGVRVPDFVPTRQNRRKFRALKQLDALVYRIIRERRRAPGDDLLSWMLEARDVDGNGMTDVQLRDEAVTLLLAGHETTAVALSMTLYLLAQNPDVEETLHGHVDGVLDGRAPTVADLEQLTYVEQVVKEAMRLFPPVWGVGREALVDTEVGGYAVPKGSTVFLMQWTVHRDARWFPEPLRFRPQRWDDTAGMPRFAYFPFGGGPRACIGKRFAMMEATLILATVAQRFALRLAPGETLDLLPSVTLRPRHGLKMVAARRPARVLRVA